MSIDFQGFTGPSYHFDNRFAAIERLSNWYCIPNESAEEGKFKILLAPSPANAQFSRLPAPAPFNQPCRGLLEHRGHVFGVNGNRVFQLTAAGAYIEIGRVDDDGRPVSMVANGTGQVFIASGGQGYVIPPNPAPNSLLYVRDGFLGASYATFQDGYILVVTPNSNQFQISGTDDVPLGDATKWSAANVSVQAGQADLLSAILSSREYVRLLGNRRSQVYTNVGNAGIGGFPFQSYNETFIETGIAAPFSLADLGDSLIWIGQDARGQRACWRDSAFQPQRISTFAVEQFWQGYDRIDDAVAFSFIWKGHLMYQITFPSAYQSAVRFPLGATSGALTGATWLYDATSSQILGRPIWSERAYQTAQGYAQQRSELFHCFAFGKHLVGSGGVDGNPGAVYQYSDSLHSDCGTSITGQQTQQAIVRDRICPHIWSGNKRIIYNRIELEMSRGVGLVNTTAVRWNEATQTWEQETQTWDEQISDNPYADAQALLRWSNDGGNTWGVEYNIPAGRIGEYSRRVYLNRCGYGRDRVFWLRCSDPVYWGILGAELDVLVCAA